jgi:hypothetical protein
VNAMPVVPNVARPVVVYVYRRPGFNIRQETTEVLYWGQDSSKSDRVIQLQNSLFGIRRLDPQWTGKLSKSGCESVVRVIRITAKVQPAPSI